jgi:hypothetical protein
MTFSWVPFFMGHPVHVAVQGPSTVEVGKYANSIL